MKPSFDFESERPLPAPFVFADSEHQNYQENSTEVLTPVDRQRQERKRASSSSHSVLGGLFWFLLPFGFIAAAWYLAPYAVERYHYAATRGRVQAEYENAVTMLMDAPLTQVSLASQLVAQKIKPSVVSIKQAVHTRRGVEPGNQGSGVVLDVEGYIITNQHVVGEAKQVLVTLHDRSEYVGVVVGRDEETDLAVIKIDAPNLLAAEWGESDHLQVGSLVWAVGSPYGLDQTVTSGIVSGMERRGRESRYQEFLQTDAAVNPGNSGGALVNLQGQVVGINTSIYGDRFQGISFAVPSSICRFVFEQLLEKGNVSRGFLGVEPGPISQDQMNYFNLPNLDGALVKKITRGTPAYRSPLRINDVIRSWNGNTVRHWRTLYRYISMSTPNSNANVEILRNGREHTIEVPIGSLASYYGG